MIPIDELKTYPSFFIETTANDKFEIVPKENGFLFRDIVPPLLEKDITNVKSVKMPTALLQSASQGKQVDMSKVLFYDGISKGFTFVFYETENEFVITKGKIDALYVKQQLGNFQFNVHLLEMSGRKENLYDYWGNDFEIRTDSEVYPFLFKGDTCFFEDREVLSVYSFFKVKAHTPVLQLDSLNLAHEYDVHSNLLYLNKPFMIVTKSDEQETQVKFTFAMENVKAIQAR